MNISFVMAEHSVLGAGHMVCQVWDGSRLMGVIYPSPDGVHIISKYLNGTEPTGKLPPGIIVKLNREAS